MIKTFRGLMADGGQDTINLHTNDGKTGYRIVKFEIFPNEPGEQSTENTVKIYKVEQPEIGSSTPPVFADNTVDFSDSTLLAVAYYQDEPNTAYPSALNVVFDTEIFNQDIYITAVDTSGSQFINYYFELEQVPLDLNEATVATLQSIRNA